MNNKLFSKAATLPVFMFALAVAGCSQMDDNSENTPGAATVSISIEDATETGKCKALLTPSENTASFVYAIGSEADLQSFKEDSMTDINTTEGNQPAEVIFEDLDSNREYYIFSKAYDNNGRPGPVAFRIAKTVDAEFKVTAQYVTDETAGLTIDFTSNYSYCEWYLGTEADREAFLNGEFDTDKIIDATIPSQTVNYYDLEPSKEYIFFVKGYDKAGICTQTREVAFTTFAEGECPKVDMNIQSQDLYKGIYRFSANDKCGKMCVLICEKGYHDMSIYNNLHFSGNIMQMLIQWESIDLGEVTFTKEKTLDAELVTPTLSPDIELEAYVLVYNNDYVPAGIQHFTFKTPSIDDKAPSCSVQVEVSDITTSGATYTFTPDANTFGFMYDTVEADWYDDIKENSSQWHEHYLHEVLFANGMYWAYVKEMTGDHVTFTETAGTPGFRYYAAACPMNKNGIRGWQPEVLMEYTTKQY